MSEADSTQPELIDPKVKAARERKLRWYYKNQKHANAKNKVWREANRERRNRVRRVWAKKPKNKAKLSASHQRWRKANPEKAAALGKKYRADNPEKVKAVSRRNHLRREYGMTTADYDAMFAEQGGRCAVCSTADPSPSPRMCVDHCHKTGIVRGLLCFNCNVSIGRLRDDPKLLAAAIRYLRERRSDRRAKSPPAPHAG